MAITLAQAQALTWRDRLHYTGPIGRYGENNAQCTRSIGPRGGVKESIIEVRVTGQVKLWKRSPGRVRVPVARGMYEHTYITESNLNEWHMAADCPLAATDGPVPYVPAAPLSPHQREVADVLATVQAAAAMMRRTA